MTVLLAEKKSTRYVLFAYAGVDFLCETMHNMDA